MTAAGSCKAQADENLKKFLAYPFKYLVLTWDEKRASLRASMKVSPIQCYSLSVLAELHRVFPFIDNNPGLVRHFVLSSEVPGVFNFGGDLALFVLLVRARDLQSLTMYGRKCVDLVCWLESAVTKGIHTTALVQGDALGGGLESVLPFHQLIFEKSAQAGFPEILFNLFPGMGAWNFVAREAGMKVATEMVLSGSLYSADEMKAFGLVDVVAEDGLGEAALEQVLRSVEPRFKGTIAALSAKRKVAVISEETLYAVVDDWAKAALQLTDRDLRLMDRLARAQLKKVGGAVEGAVEEIKRFELEAEWASRADRQELAVAA